MVWGGHIEMRVREGCPRPLSDPKLRVSDGSSADAARAHLSGLTVVAFRLEGLGWRLCVFGFKVYDQVYARRVRFRFCVFCACARGMA